MAASEDAIAAARLARLGFADAARAARLARPDTVGPAVEPWLAALADAADPDLALAGLGRLRAGLDAAGRAELDAAAARAPGLRTHLAAVLGGSAALADHLARHPEQWRELADPDLVRTRPSRGAMRADLLAAVGADPAAAVPVAGGADDDVLVALRVGYRRWLLRLAARDLAGELAVDDVAAELADLAGAVLEAALAAGRATVPAAAAARLAVVGMGKCGGRELNYASDVDVVFVAEPAPGSPERVALSAAEALAAQVIRGCGGTTAEGAIWPVDASLRPEGRHGPLVRTVASHRAYYERWAKTWEFQALLKARVVAGDPEVGQAYLDAVTPLVWQAADRPGFVEEVQAMRRRVAAHVPRGQAGRELKLGPGGLRDVEFAVQLLQLVHGRADPSLHSGTTLVALDRLTAGGYVGRADGAALAAAYRFLRSLEHRIQLFRLRRTEVVPDAPAELRRLGRSLGFTRDPVGELTEQWARHTVEVRRLHEKLFYRPLLAAVARIPGADARLSPRAAERRLAALGYADPPAALRHIAALTAGVSRRAAIQHTLLPPMLGWLADAPNPDAGLLAFRQVSDALGTTPWYLRLLRDGGSTAQRLARVLAGSRYAVGLLARSPEAVALLADDADLVPRSRAELAAEVAAAVARHDAPGDVVAAVRALRARELLRLAMADLLGLIDVEPLGAALADVSAVSVAGGLAAAVRAVEADRGGLLPTRLAVLAMGRLGGAEVGFASDADVLFVHDPVPGADEAAAATAATAVAGELRRLLGAPGADPPLAVDADLRPEGRQGPLVRTLGSYAGYYDRWAQPWEHQALLRVTPLAGDSRLAGRFVELADRLRYPAGGLDAARIREIRRVKARVDAERLPRGADPATHTKLGRGGLADVEWTVQLLQLRHAAAVPALRVPGTLPALRAATTAGLLADADAERLARAWRLASRTRNAILLVRGRPGDSLPADARELAAVAWVLGYGPAEGGRFVDDYRRTARQARAVVDRVFWS